MSKYIKIYVGRNFDGVDLIDDLFHDGYKSEACMKQQKRNIRQFKNAVKNNGDDLLCNLYKVDNWDDNLYIFDYRELKEYNPKVEFRDGKLHNTYYIDWNATLQLWFEDEYSKDNKILVRKRGDKIYRLLYLKGKKAKYNNKIFFKFRFHRSLRQKIKEQVINNNINAYKLNE
jgi:hypothetical protein